MSFSFVSVASRWNGQPLCLPGALFAWKCLKVEWLVCVWSLKISKLQLSSCHLLGIAIFSENTSVHTAMSSFQKKKIAFCTEPWGCKCLLETQLSPSSPQNIPVRGSVSCLVAPYHQQIFTYMLNTNLLAVSLPTQVSIPSIPEAHWCFLPCITASGRNWGQVNLSMAIQFWLPLSCKLY